MAGEVAHDVTGMSCGFGRVGGIDEDVAMRCRWPCVIQRPFEFDGANQKSRYVAAVDVFAANADFTNTGEIVFVLLFDIRTREVANVTFKLLHRVVVARHGLRFSNLT